MTWSRNWRGQRAHFRVLGKAFDVAGDVLDRALDNEDRIDRGIGPWLTLVVPYM